MRGLQNFQKPKTRIQESLAEVRRAYIQHSPTCTALQLSGETILPSRGNIFIFTTSSAKDQWKDKKPYTEASLVAQWLGIRLPVQGTRVWALVREDPTCRGATVCHSCHGLCSTTAEPVLWSLWATTTEPACHSWWGACAWSLCSATGEATAMRGPRTAIKSGPCSPQLQKARAQQRRPNAAKN